MDGGGGGGSVSVVQMNGLPRGVAEFGIFALVRRAAGVVLVDTGIHAHALEVVLKASGVRAFGASLENGDGDGSA